MCFQCKLFLTTDPSPMCDRKLKRGKEKWVICLLVLLYELYFMCNSSWDSLVEIVCYLFCSLGVDLHTEINWFLASDTPCVCILATHCGFPGVAFKQTPQEKAIKQKE